MSDNTRMIDLEDIIKKYVMLRNETSHGWYTVVCKVCGDHGKKGERAAFKFEDGNVGYNCFNDPDCNCSFKSDEPYLSQKMENLLTCYGIPDDVVQGIKFDILKHNNENGKSEQTKVERNYQIEPAELEMPSFFKKLDEFPEDDPWRQIAEFYLKEDRGVNPSDHPFMLTIKGDPEDDTWKKWHGRLIIPYYKNGRLIYYQGRDLTGKKKKKYESPDTNKDALMYGYDEIYRQTDEPLYICEGFFDGVNTKGVGVFGNKMTDGQLHHLRRSKRPKVIIPDRKGKGYLLAYQGIKEGWSISTPDIGDCKDVSDAMKRFGRIYTMRSLVEHTVSGFAAETSLRFYCTDLNDKR